MWKCAKGRNSSVGLEYITGRIDSWLRQYGHIRLYIQLGTCDFTSLTWGRPRYLYLNELAENEIDDSVITVRNFEKIVELAILEISFFSMQKWNTIRGHPKCHMFERQDRNLSVKIRSVNEHIHRINRLNRVHSPLLNVDLEISRKDRRRRIRYYISYNLYTDGVHPIHEMNKCWLRKLTVKIRPDCFETICISLKEI